MEKIDFKYDLDYHYDIGTTCGNDCDEDYCHHGTVENVHIRGTIDFYDISRVISEHYKQFNSENKIQNYCLQRLCALLDKDSFAIEIEDGYYGEELGTITLHNQKLFDDFFKIKDDNKMIEYTLEREYGFVPPNLLNKQWQYKKVPLTKVKANMPLHKINKERLEFYKKHLSETCLLCVQDGKNYRLIDGRHRFLSLNPNAVHEIDIIYSAP